MARIGDQGIAILTTESKPVDLAGTIPVDTVDARDLVEIKKAGYGVRPIGLGSRGYQLTETKPTRVLQIHPRAIASPEITDLERMLLLEPYQTTYPVKEAPEGQFLRAQGDRPSTNVTITTRSILEVMYLLSKTVAVPEEHREKGLVRFTRNPDGSPFDWFAVSGDLFHVCVSKHRPDSAFVAVKYRDYWYYIQDNDLSSKVTINLFNELLRLQKIGGVEGQPAAELCRLGLDRSGMGRVFEGVPLDTPYLLGDTANGEVRLPQFATRVIPP